ncbi:MAG: peptidylprolyl isomerase [Nanoarchaeota archaeon]|nr:peptidylprolyl isomerase [Nanoarchaeota archaeon]
MTEKKNTKSTKSVKSHKKPVKASTETKKSSVHEDRIAKLKAKHLKRQVTNIVFMVFVVAIIAFGAMMIYNGSKEGSGNNLLDFFKKSDASSAIGTDSEPAAVVDGTVITMAELNQKFDSLPPEYQSLIPKEKMLEQIIDEKLMLNEAKKRNIVAAETEIDQTLSDLLSSYQMSEEELKQELSVMGMTYEDFKDRFRTEIIITKLLNATILENADVTDEELVAYYNENIEQYVIPETLNASHILICHDQSQSCESNSTKEEALAKIEEIQERINNGEDFGELAYELSEGPSNVQYGNLGLFAKGQMVPEFEEAAFALDVDEVSDVVETDFGYHLIKVHEKIPEETVDFEIIRPQLEQTLLVEKQQALYQDFISGVKKDAEITIFYQPVQTEEQA